MAFTPKSFCLALLLSIFAVTPTTGNDITSTVGERHLQDVGQLRVIRSAEGELDGLDAGMEARHKPQHLTGWMRTLLIPPLGLVMFFLAFPVLWFNEQRAFGRAHQNVKDVTAVAECESLPQTDEIAKDVKETCKPFLAETEGAQKDEEAPSEISTVASTAPAAAPEIQSMLERGAAATDRAYASAVESFGARLGCDLPPCQCIHSLCDRLPEPADDRCNNAELWMFRLLGFVMMYAGADMVLFPLYFVLHLFWLFGFIIAGHLAFCVCKGVCCAASGTVCVSHTVHRPMVLLAAVLLCAACIGITCYFVLRPALHHGKSTQ